MSLIEQGLLTEYRQTSQRETLAKASTELLNTLGVVIEAEGSLPQKGPLLVISDHSGSLDSHVVIGTSGRDDLNIVALASYKIMGQEYEGKLLPIYVKRRIRDKLASSLLGDLGTHALEDREDIRNRNRDTISRAAELVSNGGAVAIFPTGTGGSGSAQGTWKVGVGFLIKQIQNSETQVVFTKITGGDELDIFRYLDSRIRKLLFAQKEIKIQYSAPKSLSSLVDQNNNGKQIALELEKLHREKFV